MLGADWMTECDGLIVDDLVVRQDYLFQLLGRGILGAECTSNAGVPGSGAYCLRGAGELLMC